MASKLNVFVLGATGEVGKEIVKELAKNCQIEKVTIIGRRELELPSDSNYVKFSQKKVEFENLNQYADIFEGYDVGFCALGTTRGKAGKEGFYKVDHDYIVNSAKLAKGGGCKHFCLVSAQGANKNSYIYYNQVKGAVEEEISALKFDRFSIFRPAMLLCDRTESRPTEAVARFVVGHLDVFRCASVEVPLLARVMVEQCLKNSSSNVEIVHNKAINEMGKVYKST